MTSFGTCTKCGSADTLVTCYHCAHGPTEQCRMPETCTATPRRPSAKWVNQSLIGSDDWVLSCGAFTCSVHMGPDDRLRWAVTTHPHGYRGCDEHGVLATGVGDDVESAKLEAESELRALLRAAMEELEG